MEVTGQIVVEAGGTLSVGTLSIGGPEERPVVTGSGQIVVKAGGTLRLTCASLDGNGECPMIIQEPGGSVVFQDVASEEGLVQWSSPLVDNLYDQPDDIWLESGTALTPEMLPDATEATVQYQGGEEDQTLSLTWDLSAYDGRTEGELTLTGSFLGADGLPLLSMVPLELTVHWYTPQTLTVTQAVWKGESVPSVQLTVTNLPEFAEVWGEVSTDDGKTWTRWADPDNIFIVSVEYEEGSVCVFRLPDETPRWFRIVAHDPREHLYWRSDSFYVSREDQDDSGGNRGGSITPSTPDREPTPPEDDTLLELKPSLEPDVPDDAVDEPAEAGTDATTPETVPVEEPPVTTSQPSGDAAAPASASEPETPEESDVQTPPAEEESTAPAQEESTVSPAVTEKEFSANSVVYAASPPAEEASQTKTALPMAVQVLLVAAGIAVCAAAVLAAARVGPFRKKS